MKLEIKTVKDESAIKKKKQTNKCFKTNYTKKELKQKIIDCLYEKEIYTMEDVELIKVILKD